MTRSSPPVWLFDLDGTLHDVWPEIMPRIDRAMTAFVMRHLALDEAQASALRVRYWHRYGATLLGLVRYHGVDPHAFLRETHVFPDMHRLVRRDARLAQLLRRLPGRKVVLTNAPAHYARPVLAALGVWRRLHDVITIEDMRFAGRLMPKPSRAMLRKLLARLRVPARRCVLVEDTLVNLRAARHCGLRTVWVNGYPADRTLSRVSIGRGRRSVDVQVRTVVQLARTPLAGRADEQRK